MTNEFVARVRALQAAVALCTPNKPGDWSARDLDHILTLAMTFETWLNFGQADTLHPLRAAAKQALDELDQR